MKMKTVSKIIVESAIFSSFEDSDIVEAETIRQDNGDIEVLFNVSVEGEENVFFLSKEEILSMYDTLKGMEE